MHEPSFEDNISIISETKPTPFPLASSTEAMKVVPAAKGRKEMVAPVLVVSSEEGFGMGMERGDKLKGRSVKVRGRAAGSLPAEKLTLKGPH
jgi:hypothetical protein